MQHLSPQLSKQLEALGLVSESETFWYRKKTNPGAWFLTEYTPVYSRTHESIQAFTIADILLNANNARKLWGDTKVLIGKGGFEVNHYWDSVNELSRYIFESHILLDLILTGTDIEPELQKAIENIDR